MKNFKLPYKIDIFENKYLRVLYLPNNMKYRHESGDADIFSWILSVPNKEQKNDEVQSVSYIKDWNKEEETDKMLKFLKEFELLTNLNSEQIELYKTKKLTYKKD